MDKLLFYEIDEKYIDFLSQFSEHLFHNAKVSQTYSRKYVGILFEINGINYFAPLSSFKPKHKRLSETVDFIKIGDMAVINLNNMFPVPENAYSLKNPNTEKNQQYRTLLNNEIRIIKQKTEQIINNAKTVYNHKMTNDGKSKLSQVVMILSYLRKNIRNGIQVKEIKPNMRFKSDVGSAPATV